MLRLGLPVGCEFLDPIIPQYIADTVAWGSIGARTVESQVHRQLASGLSMPIGMKNRPDGSIATAVDAIRAAGVPHVFPGIDVSGTPAILHTRGNADCHLVLRGGGGGPNYDAAAVAGALALLRAAGLPERLVIDASHGNSGKDHRRQPLVAADMAAQLAAGQRGIVGVMLESFLVPGRQDLDPTRRWRTASRSPTPAWAGRRPPSRCGSWRRRCGPGGRSPRHRPDRHLPKTERRPRLDRGRRLCRCAGRLTASGATRLQPNGIPRRLFNAARGHWTHRHHYSTTPGPVVFHTGAVLHLTGGSAPPLPPAGHGLGGSLGSPAHQATSGRGVVWPNPRGVAADRDR